MQPSTCLAQSQADVLTIRAWAGAALETSVGTAMSLAVSQLGPGDWLETYTNPSVHIQLLQQRQMWQFPTSPNVLKDLCVYS